MVEKASPTYDATLREIGRIATTWAKFEHWVDQAIWILAEVQPRRGAAMTSQIGSIHGKFRSLLALMMEAGRPEPALKIARQITERTAAVVVQRNLFAHGPLDMGANFDTRTFDVYLRRVRIHGKSLELDTEVITIDELDKANTAISALYKDLMDHFAEIVGQPWTDAMNRQGKEFS